MIPLLSFLMPDKLSVYTGYTAPRWIIAGSRQIAEMPFYGIVGLFKTGYLTGISQEHAPTHHPFCVSAFCTEWQQPETSACHSVMPKVSLNMLLQRNPVSSTKICAAPDLRWFRCVTGVLNIFLENSNWSWENSSICLWISDLFFLLNLIYWISIPGKRSLKGSSGFSANLQTQKQTVKRQKSLKVRQWHGIQTPLTYFVIDFVQNRLNVHYNQNKSIFANT